MNEKNYEYIDIKYEDDLYYYIKLKHIPRELFTKCLDKIKDIDGKYFPDEIYWQIKKDKIDSLSEELHQIIDNFNDIEQEEQYNKITNFLDIEFNKLKNKNKKLELSNNIIKYLRTYSIELNRLIYKGEK